MTAQLSSTYTLTVGEVAAASGVATSAVRFYEQHGVVRAERTATDQRRFSTDAACRIRVAKVAQRVGLTVREIADVFAALPEHPSPEEWGGVAETLIREAEERTAALRSYLSEMRSGARLCDL